jgi:hypothetical protein
MAQSLPELLSIAAWADWATATATCAAAFFATGAAHAWIWSTTFYKTRKKMLRGYGNLLCIVYNVCVSRQLCPASLVFPPKGVEGKGSSSCCMTEGVRTVEATVKSLPLIRNPSTLYLSLSLFLSLLLASCCGNSDFCRALHQ